MQVRKIELLQIELTAIELHTICGVLDNRANSLPAPEMKVVKEFLKITEDTLYPEVIN